MTKIITKIEVLDTKEDFVELASMANELTVSANIDMPIAMKIDTVFIRGQRFRRANGQDVVIGWCEQLADLLDLPMEVYDNMSQEITTLHQKNRTISNTNLALKADIYNLSNMSRWSHFKAIFRRL